MITVTVTHHTSHPFSYLSSLPLVTDPITVALNDCARDRLHKDRCMQAFGRNTLSKPHSMGIDGLGGAVDGVGGKVNNTDEIGGQFLHVPGFRGLDYGVWGQ